MDKEVKSGINTDVYKPHSTASNTMVYKSGVLLEEVLKRGQWSNSSTFFSYFCREINE